MYVRLLGAVGAGSSADEVSVIHGTVGALVLAQLAMADGKYVTADSLIQATWSMPPVSARNAVQVAINRLRKQFGAQFIQAQRAGYALSSAGLEVDWTLAKDSLKASRDSAETHSWSKVLQMSEFGIQLFLADPMAGLRADMADLLRSEAAVLRCSLEQLKSTALIELGRSAQALEILRPLTAGAPLDEPLHVLLMRALAHDGHQAEALQIYQNLRLRLVMELGIDPAAATVQAYVSLLSPSEENTAGASFSDPHFSGPDSAAGGSETATLPQPMTPMYGRATELDQVTKALVSGHRLVTIVGPIGIGKSRLALEVAHQLMIRHPRPAALINMADLQTSPFTHSAIEVATEVRSRIDRVIDRNHRGWGRSLTSTGTLLLLDNVAPADRATAAAVTALLEIPGIDILLTCVGPLHLSAEYVIELPPLVADTQKSALRILLDQAAIRIDQGRTPRILHERIAGFASGIPLLLELLGSALAWRGADELSSELLTAGRAAGWLGYLHPALDRPERHRSFAAAVKALLVPTTEQQRIAIAALLLNAGEFDESAAAQMIVTADPTAEPRLVLSILLDLAILQRRRRPESITFRFLPAIRAGMLASGLIPLAPPAVHERHAQYHLARVLAPAERIPAASCNADLLRAMNWIWARDQASATEQIAPALFHWHRNSIIRPIEGKYVRHWVTTILHADRENQPARCHVAVVGLLDLLRWRDDEPGDLDRILTFVDPHPEQLCDPWLFRWVLAESEYWRIHPNADNADRSLGLLQNCHPTVLPEQVGLDLALLRWYRHADNEVQTRDLVLKLFRRWDSAHLFGTFADATHEVFRAFLGLGELELADRVLRSGAAGFPQQRVVRNPASHRREEPNEYRLRQAVDQGWMQVERGKAATAPRILHHVLESEAIAQYRLVTLVEAATVTGFGLAAAGRVEEAHAMATLAGRLVRPVLLDGYAEKKLSKLLSWAQVVPDDEKAVHQSAVKILRAATGLER